MELFTSYFAKGGNVMAVSNIPIHQLLPGMIVAEDVYSTSKQIILNRNTLINPKSINKLSIYGIKEIIVYIPQSIANKVDLKIQLPVNKRKESLEYKKFKKYYLDIIEEMKILFSALLKSEANYLELSDIVSKIEILYQECGNSMRTFDMLHCMREYNDLTYVHSLNVALMCYSFGTWINYSKEEIKKVTLAGLLHDIGKLKIPVTIIAKPDILTPIEYRIVKQHSFLGYDIVKNIDFDEAMKQAILTHHERCDGSGYPHGYKTTQINNYAKIVAITDVYDAMTSNRVYRDAICPFDVLEKIENDGYEKYDPTFLIPFLQQIAQSYIGTTVILDNSLVGDVVMINKTNITRPIVKVEDKFYDLSKLTYLKIKEFL